MSSLCSKCGARRGVSYRMRTRAVLLQVMENPLSTPSEKLHACDDMILMFGYGGRHSSGPKRKKGNVERDLKEAAKQIVDDKIQKRDKQHADSRLREILQDVSAPSSTDTEIDSQ